MRRKTGRIAAMTEYTWARQEKRLGKNRRVRIQNTWIDVLDMQETVALTEQYIREKEPLHLIGVNADKINALNRDSRLRQIVNSCGIINADGASVILAGKFLGKELPERVAGVDLMQELVALSERKGYRVYLLGARQEVVEETAAVLQKKYPGLQLAGFRNGYFADDEWPEVSRQLAEARPDIVFVGITSPKKEYLVEYLQEEGHRAVFMGVGGSFDVLSGRIPRAPRWMQKANLEWVFRMMQEPGRLLRRYLVGNTVFIASVFREKLRKY